MTLLIQSTTETVPGWLSLALYLVPAAVALFIVAAALRRRWKKGGVGDEQ